MDTTRIRLAALWTVVMFNMAFADILGFLHPGTLQTIIAGEVGVQLTQEMLLVFSLLIEIPILMIVMSLVLSVPATRWLSTAAAIVTALFVIGGGSATYSYIFFATVEVACMSVIVWYVWKHRGLAPAGASV